MTENMVRLGDATMSLDSVRRPVKASDRKAGPYPYYGASGIVDYVDDYLFDETSLLVSEDGENLRSRKTPIAFLAHGKYWVNNHAHVLRAKEGFDLHYILYAMQVTDISGFLTGSTQPKLTAGSLQDIRIPDRPLPEQQRIAGVLKSIDALIDENETLASQLGEAAQITVARASTRVPLSELASPVTVRQVRPTGNVEHYSLPAFDRGAVPERTDGGTIMSNKLPLTEPAVLVSRLNPQTPRAWMAYPAGTAVASTEFAPLRGKGGVTPEEVWAMVSAAEYWRSMRSLVTGTTGSHQRVDREALLTIRVADARELPQRHREQVVRMVQAAQGCREEARDLMELRDMLLPLLISGRIAVEKQSEAA